MRIFFLIPCAVLFFSCATQFTVIKEELLGTEGKRKTLYQAILVTNPPWNREKLDKMMEAYNRQTISYVQLREYSISRRFYKQSFFLRKDFEEGKPYPMLLSDYWIWNNVQRLEGHWPVMRSFYSIDVSGHYFYIHFKYGSWNDRTKDRGRVSYTIDDPENYFLGE